MGPMDAFTDPDVETLVVMSAAQVGKSEFENNCMGYIVDQEPGPALVVYPTEREMKKTMRNRLHPMFRSSPALRDRILGGPDCLGLDELHFDRCTFYSGWSNSPATLASTPCRYVFYDEVNKFPRFSGNDASPWKLGEKRTRTFRGRRKIVGVSTPTRWKEGIHAEFIRTNQQRYWVPCPKCGRYQELDFFKGVKWPEEATGEEIVAGRLAWYQCQHCEEKLVDEQKPRMLMAGKWCPKGCEIDEKGEIQGDIPPKRRSGFQISGLLSPWVSYSEFAAEFLDSKSDPERFFDFITGGLGLPWKEKEEEVSDTLIRKREKPYQPRVVPKWAKVLTCGVDVQAGHFWFAVRAWGSRARSALVDCGMLTTVSGGSLADEWAPVASLLRGSYPIEDTPGGMKISRMCVDAGDRQEEVLSFTRKNRPVTIGTKGSGNLKGPIAPATKIPGLLLFRANHWKDRLWRHITTNDDEPGEWWVFEGVGEEYRKHMTAEHRVRDKNGYPKWVPVVDGRPNHLWDCEVLNGIAADGLGVSYLDDDSEPAITDEQRKPRRERKSWLKRLDERFQ